MPEDKLLCKCFLFHSVQAHAVCLSCRTSIFTTKELKDKQRALEKKIKALTVERDLLTAELFLRKRYQTETDSENKTTKHCFWEDVKKAPREKKVEKGFSAEIINILLS
jgi:glycerol-3-phosphate O-acyltransferase